MIKITPKYLIIHHAVTPQDVDVHVIDQAHKNRWHGETLSSLGWYIGYNYVIGANYVVKAREDYEMGAHTYGWNDRAMAICFTGNYEIDKKPLPYQESAFVALAEQLMKEWSIPLENVLFHRDTKATACPGKNITKEYIFGLLAAHQLTQIGMQYENMIVQNVGKGGNGEFSFVLNGKRRPISTDRAGVAALTALQRESKIVALPSEKYNAIPVDHGF